MWKSWIKNRGILKTAEDLQVEYESVRRWVNGAALPSDKNKKRLVELANGEFGFADFFIDLPPTP